jgi:hypothetical protein
MDTPSPQITHNPSAHENCDIPGCIAVYVELLISLWLFLFAPQPEEFFLDGLKKLQQQSRKCVELRGKYVQ